MLKFDLKSIQSGSDENEIELSYIDTVKFSPKRRLSSKSVFSFRRNSSEEESSESENESIARAPALK